MTHTTYLEFSNRWRFIAVAEVFQFYLLKLVDSTQQREEGDKEEEEEGEE